MSWIIDKEFHFEMGHRVWAQELKHNHLSLSTECSCKHLHGHSYVIKVFLSAYQLDDSSMVTDFKNLNFMKDFVDNVLDHKFMIDINDPNFDLITGVGVDVHEGISVDSLSFRNFTNLATLCATSNERIALHRSSFVLVDFVPTSENMCRYIKTYAQSMLGEVAVVSAVELWETKKSHCRYE